MKKVLSTLLYRIWLVSASLIILFAALISIGRALLPYANTYKSDIELALSERLGQQVSIGSISSNWKSLGPSITMRDVDIKDTISLQSVSADIKTIPSLFYQTLITENLVIEGINIYIEQQPDGTMIIDGQSTQLTAEDSEPFDYGILQDWLQSQTEITISEATIQFNLRNEDSFPINISEMRFSRGVDMYQLQGFTQLPGDNRIDFALEADGLLTNPDTKAQLFIDSHELDLTELPLGAFWQEARIVDGTVKLNAWVDWSELRFSKAIATLDLLDFQMTLQDAPQGNINKLSSQLQWQIYDDGWQLQTNNAEVVSNDRSWPSPFVQLRMRRGENYTEEYYLRSTRMDVGVWADLLLAKQDLEPQLRTRLLAMDPQGFLDAVQIDAVTNASELVDLNLTARFSELGFKSYGAAPGVNNMAGQVQLFEDSGSLYLDSRFAEFTDPQLFRWELPLDYINTNIGWTISEETVELEIKHFTSHIHGAKLKSDGRISIPLADSQVQMDIYAELTDGDMSNTPKFLPYGIMKPDLVEYLDNAIGSGTLTDVKVLLRGSGDTFPYQDFTGVFAIHGKVLDSTYTFEPSWPSLNNMNADLWFIGNSMDIKVNSARSYEHQINSARVGIEDFNQKPSILLIESRSEGNLSDAGDYILNSPLSEDISPVLETLDLKGPFELDLDMIIPLGDSDEKIAGEIRVNDASVHVKAIGLDAEAVNGSLQINGKSVTSKNLSANILGGASRVTLAQTGTDTGVTTEITSLGDITLAAVYETFSEIIPTGLEGATDYTAVVSIPAGDGGNFSVTVDTRTIGMTSNIPHPLSKTADVGLPLKLLYEQTAPNESLLSINWLDKFSLLSAYLDGEMTSGVMAMGTNDVSLPNHSGVAITGVADTVDLVAWLDYLSDRESTISDGEESDFTNFYLDNLSIQQLNYFFLTLNNTNVSGDLGQEQLEFNLEGDDINGQITVPLPFGQTPINIALDKLAIVDQFADEETDETESDKQADAEPLPAINLSCRQCLYAGIELGSTEAVLQPLERGNQVSITIGTDNILSMDIDAQWQWVEDEVVTELDGTVKTQNLGRLLDILHQDAGIRDTPMEITGKLSWVGDPSMFNTVSLSGDLSVEGGKGSQKTLSDRQARIFSLFSLGSIARKLTLDFSDLFQDGFFYTGLSGNLNFNKGTMKTEDIQVRGTSADVQVKGNINFASNTIEQCILVTPDLGSSLPVLAGWAIEPMTGFLVFVMSKIFEPAINVVTSIQYQVEGSFDDPTVTEVGKSTGKATISEDTENPSITVEAEQKTFSCDGEFN